MSPRSGYATQTARTFRRCTGHEVATDCSGGRQPAVKCDPKIPSRAAATEKSDPMAGTYTNLLYHLVFSTKQRLSLITKELQPDLYSYIGGIIRGEGGTLLEIGGMPDHVHLLAKFKPTGSISDMLKVIKAGSSKWINEEQFKMRKFGWQDGYAAFTVSESQGYRRADARRYTPAPLRGVSKMPTLIVKPRSGDRDRAWVLRSMRGGPSASTDILRQFTMLPLPELQFLLNLAHISCHFVAQKRKTHRFDSRPPIRSLALKLLARQPLQTRLAVQIRCNRKKHQAYPNEFRCLILEYNGHHPYGNRGHRNQYQNLFQADSWETHSFLAHDENRLISPSFASLHKPTGQATKRTE